MTSDENALYPVVEISHVEDGTLEGGGGGREGDGEGEREGERERSDVIVLQTHTHTIPRFSCQHLVEQAGCRTWPPHSDSDLWTSAEREKLM